MAGLDDIKGLSRDDLKKIQSYIDDAYSKGKSEGGKTKTKEDYSDFENSLDAKTATGFGDAFSEALGPLNDAKTAVAEMAKGLDPTNFQGADFLMKSGQELANAMGLGQARMSEMKITIADAIPQMLKLGITSDDAFDVLKDVPTSLGVNTTMGTEALVEMGAAAKVSGVETKKLAQEFKGVGISLYDVGDRMAEVANYAKSVGVNVKAVSAEVVSNLKQLNLFNFDSGVKGLAKMASQASMLGFDMQKTFKLAEDLMSPEKAIDLSASLQRLGVSSSALLDPLKAMDLAQNDPEALQKEIVNVSKEFTKFNEKTGKFEIMPGAKRRLREVAQAMGMSADELANMSIKSADLDMKMSKIKFPSLAASEEDKMLIANMSQMKGGEAVVQIKNEKTGAMEEVNVSKLTAEQITKLKEQQADQNKSIEELALDQLNVLQSIDAGINGGKAAVTLGKATAPAMDRFYTAMNVVRAESVKAVTRDVTTGKVREQYGAVTGDVEGAGVKMLQGDFSGAIVDMSKLGPDLLKIGKEIATGFGSALVEGYGNIKQGVQTVYSPVTGDKPVSNEDKSSQLYEDLKSITSGSFVDNIVKAFNMVTTKNETDINIKVDGSSSLPNGLSAEQFKSSFEKYINDPTNKSEVQKLLASQNSGLTNK